MVLYTLVSKASWMSWRRHSCRRPSQVVLASAVRDVISLARSVLVIQLPKCLQLLTISNRPPQGVGTDSSNLQPVRFERVINKLN